MDPSVAARIAQSTETNIQGYFKLLDSTVLELKITIKTIWNSDEIGVIQVESKIKFVTQKSEIRRQQVCSSICSHQGRCSSHYCYVNYWTLWHPSPSFLHIYWRSWKHPDDVGGDLQGRMLGTC